MDGILDSFSQYKLMVPFLDVFNHSENSNVEWNFVSREGRRGYYINAKRDIEVGEELTGCYGPSLSN